MPERTRPRTRPPRLIGVTFLPEAVLIRLRGDLDEGLPADIEALAHSLAAATEPIVINVAGVSSMNTAGLRWLMRLTREARRQGRSLILESPTPCVAAVLALTGCHTWFSAATRPGPDGRTDTARLIHTLSA